MTTAQMVQNMANPSHRCSCGCSDCQGECCSLECLIRPNFFCGQLLPDRDLKVFVDWVSAKSALQRLREVSGVVCVLETTCNHNDMDHNPFYVGEALPVGYSGRDVVVCGPVWSHLQCDPV